MRLRFWIAVAVASCASPSPKPAPSPTVASVPAPTPPPPEVKPEPGPDAADAAAPPAELHWTPTFFGASDPPMQSLAPLRLGNDVSKPASGETYVVRLERTPCFGDCPAYAVELSADGTIAYTDKDEKGAARHATGTIPAASVAKLAKRLLAAGFFRFTWDEPCKQRWTDNPGAIVTVVDHGRKRTIVDDYGSMCIPRLMRTLESEIDAVAATATWL